MTYFKKDEKKEGGAYLQKTAQIKRVDDVERILYFMDGSNLPIDDVIDIQGDIFTIMERDEYDI